MTLPIRKATPAELEAANLNRKRYGEKTAPVTPAPKAGNVRNYIQNQLSGSGSSDVALKNAIDAASTKFNRPASKPAPSSALPQPVPTQPRTPSISSLKPAMPPSMPMEQVEIDKQKAQAEMLAKQNLAPIPGVGRATSSSIGAPMPDPGKGNNMQGPGMGAPMNPPVGPGTTAGNMAMKRGGSVRNKPSAKFSSGGSTSKASSRGDGIAQRGKTKGRYI